MYVTGNRAEWAVVKEVSLFKPLWNNSLLSLYGARSALMFLSEPPLAGQGVADFTTPEGAKRELHSRHGSISIGRLLYGVHSPLVEPSGEQGLDHRVLLI